MPTTLLSDRHLGAIDGCFQGNNRRVLTLSPGQCPRCGFHLSLCVHNLICSTLITSHSTTSNKSISGEKGSTISIQHDAVIIHPVILMCYNCSHNDSMEQRVYAFSSSQIQNGAIEGCTIMPSTQSKKVLPDGALEQKEKVDTSPHYLTQKLSPIGNHL